MTYLQRSRSGSRRLFVPVFVTVLFLLLIWSLHSYRSSLIETPIMYVAYPIWKLEDVLKAKFNGVISAVSSKRKLQEENRLLQEKVRAAELAAYSAEVYMRENESLKAALNRVEDPSNFMMAYVLAGPPQTPYDTFILDVGSKNGIEIGMKIQAEGIAFGEVIDVGSRVSKGRLYSSPEVSTEVYLENSDSRVIAHGKGGGNFLIELPKGITIENGDAVLLPGDSVSLLGIVGRIESKPSDPFDNVYVSSPVNIFEVPFVFIDLRKAGE